MSLRTFAPRTFVALTFAAVTLHGTGTPITPLELTPVSTLALPVRLYSLTLTARSYSLALVARSPQLALPTRVYTLTIPPRGQGGLVALALPTKQPSETYITEIFCTQYLPMGRTIASAELFASRKDTTMASAVNQDSLVDATTLIMADNPGKGARLTINAAGATTEVVKASAVSGTSPCTVTVAPALMFGHISGEQISYEPGYSTGVLVSTAPTVTTTNVYPVLTRGIHGHTYRVSMLLTLDNGNLLEAEFDVPVSDT